MSDHDVYCRYIDGVFAPREVEAMTGVSALLQRTWQRRGFLGPRKVGRAALNAHELAQVMALQIAAQTLKADLKFIHEAVSDAAPAILYFALAHKKAWDVEGTREQQAAFKKVIAEEDMNGLYYLDKMVGFRQDHHSRFLVRRAEDWLFTADLHGMFDDQDIGGAIVLDLMEIGRRIADSPQRPRALIIATDIEIGGRRKPPRTPTKKKG